MTKFADQLLDDLIREHGPVLAHAAPPATPARHAPAGRKLVMAGAGGVAVAAAAAGVLVAGGGTPAYAGTTHSSMSGGRLTSPPAPSCISLPAPAAPAAPGGTGQAHGGNG